MPIPTVKIKHPHATGDYAVINADDFDPKRHERYDGKPHRAAPHRAAPERPASPSEPAPAAPEADAEGDAPADVRVERSGSWKTVYAGGEKVWKGLSADEYADALAAYGLTPDDVEEVQ